MKEQMKERSLKFAGSQVGQNRQNERRYLGFSQTPSQKLQCLLANFPALRASYKTKGKKDIKNI